MDQGTNTGQALHRLIRQGRSFSGYERNRCYLNTMGRFANISAASGIDFPDDGRGLAVVDWDLDGDLDLWLANRNGPQLRFLQNNTETDHHFLLLRLEGKTCNRDAIGARITLHVAGESPQVKTLRAGDSFLSQSSKWVHFGLANKEQIEKVVVRWPGGSLETFDGFQSNGHFRLVQDSAAPQRVRIQQPKTPLQVAAITAKKSIDPPRVWSFARVPLPYMEYNAFDGSLRLLKPRANRPLLVNLWASWCAPCISELRELTQEQARVRGANLDVLALTVNGLGGDDDATAKDAQTLLERIDFPFQSGQISAHGVEKLQLLHDTLFDAFRPLPVPVSFLISPEGDVAAIYRGAINIEVLLDDITKLAAPAQQRREMSVPMSGRWFSPASEPRRNAVMDYLFELLDAGYKDDALAYVRHATRRTPDDHVLHLRLGAKLAELGKTKRSTAHLRRTIELVPDHLRGHDLLGVALVSQGELNEGYKMIQRALQIAPDDAHAIVNLGFLFIQAGRIDEAIKHLSRAVQISPYYAPAHNNLALALMRKGDLSRGLHHCDEALRIDPDYAEAHNNCGVVLAKLGRYDEAAKHLKKALAIRPDYPEAKKNLEIVLDLLR